jgi:tyrosinase
MGIVEVSAFEPLFWVHHWYVYMVNDNIIGEKLILNSNMDRIIALYQSRYPDTWLEDSEQASGTFAVAKGSILGTSSPLAPFHRNSFGDMWTATTSRDWTSFGYTYPELLDNPSNETLTSSINRLYEPEIHGLNNTNTTVPISEGNVTTGPDKGIDWLCEVNMPTDIKISYSVRAFLGEPDADPTKWPTDANYIGQLASMSSPRMNSSVIVTGSIGLTEKLAEKHQTGELKSLDKATVTAYLKANFTWRIQALDFSEIPRNNPPAGLNVTVFNVPVTIPVLPGQVPTWDGDIEYNEDIEGNPPVYDGTGLDGTNSTLPVGDVGGSYNATSGEYEWKDAPNPDAVGDESTRTLMPLVTQYVTVSSSMSEAPKSTVPAGVKTEYVTSVVVEYVTVYT